VTYVQTTAGAAEAFFRPNRVDFENVPEDTPAWAFVAHGEFVLSAAGVGGTPVPLSTAWVVILKDVYWAAQSAYSNQEYDLGNLGDTKELPASAYSQY
jgi:hypothetical protein